MDDNYAYDVTYDHLEGKYRIMLDMGEEVVYFDRQDLMEMLEMLVGAEDSAL